MNDSLRSCAGCEYWDPCSPADGKCRRYAPAAVLCANAGENGPASSWPWTLAQDWCGEWQPRDASPLEQGPPPDSEEERLLRNASIAEALLVLPPEKRDRLLIEVLTEEERQSPTPPDDFYERVQDYLGRRQDGEEEQGT